MEISITWNICRVCLAEEEKKSQQDGVAVEPMRNIFDEDEMLAKQIYQCSGITMKPSDNLPAKICKKCFTLIKYAVNFRETCRASDVYLRNILQRTKSASTLLKKQKPVSEPLEEIISTDTLSVDNTEGEGNETLDSSNCKTSHFKDCEYSDLIEFENENDGKNSTVSDDSDDSQIILHLNNSNFQLNEDTEEKQESAEEDFNDETVRANSEDEDDYNVENYEQFEFIAHEETSQRDVELDIESESEDGLAKVSSTVAIRESGNENAELEAEDTKLSSESNDMQTEYVVDEFLIDNNSRDSMSLKSSSVLLVHSKKRKAEAKKYETRFKVNLEKTTRSKAENEFQVWVCDMCGNHFSNRQILKAHIKVHRQEKNHECEICFKRFITACNLQAHMRIHTGEKPFECKYCGRRFSDRSSNLRHERTHTNEKPFECKQCGKAFSLGTTLKKHLKVHSSERSFRCDICDKSFKLPHQLKAHKNSILHKDVEQLAQMNQ